MALQGKTAVVTGGARGIGHAYCRRLAADGANVVVVNRSDPTESLAKLSGPGKKMGLTCDVSQPDQVEAVRRQVIDRFGRCDILVNNAGIFRAPTALESAANSWSASSRPCRRFKGPPFLKTSRTRSLFWFPTMQPLLPDRSSTSMVG